MEIEKKVGIWMDHAEAHIIDFPLNEVENEVIISTFTQHERERTIAHGESEMHHAQQHEEAAYYHKIAQLIRNYDNVLLFGPTEAKQELMNLLKHDHKYAAIKFEVKSSDKLQPKEEERFVENHFTHSKE